MVQNIAARRFVGGRREVLSVKKVGVVTGGSGVED